MGEARRAVRAILHLSNLRLVGPARTETAHGDHQSPEGFYTIGKGQLNPNSHYHRAFNLGFPNLFDAANSRTGDALMVHGSCAVRWLLRHDRSRNRRAVGARDRRAERRDRSASRCTCSRSA